MRRLAQIPLVLLTIAALAACSASTTGGTPQASAQAPTPGASAGGGGGGACAVAAAGATATVTVQIKDFKFSPQPVQAKVGDVVAWTNQDGSTPHSATMDTAGCDTNTINGGATAMLVFSQAGTYTYHCSIHPTQMKDYTVVVQ